ncbi:hypothetical protein P4200_18855 [Pseudomonas aeruginosa]|nr:hypothetical protein [Pseudomonas aeruginosa]
MRKQQNAFAGIGSTAVFQLRAFMADRVGDPRGLPVPFPGLSTLRDPASID